MNLEKSLLSFITQMGAVIRRDNAVAPINSLALVGSVVCFVAAYYLPNIMLPLAISGITLLGLAAAAYFFFLIRDPGRLQSEKYQLSHARLQQALIAKELSRPLTANELSPPTSNPALLSPPKEMKIEVKE